MEKKVTEQKFKFPTETVDLPSKGLIYPKDNPLSSGKVEMKYMTAKEEDILTNQNYIQKGTVLDKLLESLIISKVNLNDMIIGDKNALLIASRVLGYGKDYTFKGYSENEKGLVEFEVDLTTLKDKHFDPKDLKEQGINEFDFNLPTANIPITFKILTHGDEKKIERELEGLQKIKKDSSPEISTRLKYIITSIEGDRESKTIREYIDNYLLAKDSRALREHIRNISPDVDLVYREDDAEEGITIPINLNFFWPDSTI
tara:strand:+ start:51 stop:824 length:774 start_codon:yes stop_codon:yes gene_type:complete